MANEVVKQDAVIKFMSKMDEAIQSALPTHVVKSAFCRAVQTALRKNPKLMQCTPASLGSAISDSAQFGLIIGLTGHLVPYGKEATLLIDYKGLLDMAYRNERVASIDCDVICENDEFSYTKGDKPNLTHKPNLRERGKPYAAYAIAWLKDSDRPIFVVLSNDEIEKVRDSSRAGKSGPWVDWWEEMAKKTALKRLCKIIPKSIELQSALSFERQQEERTVQATVVEPSRTIVEKLKKKRGRPKKEEQPKEVEAKPVENEQESVPGLDGAWLWLQKNYESKQEEIDAVLDAAGLPGMLEITIENLGIDAQKALVSAAKAVRDGE